MKDKIIAFCWQHFLLLISLWIMTVGVAVCVRSMLGSSVISVLPYVFQTAGKHDLVPALTIGQYTYIMNAILVIGQICVLRKDFEIVQLFQLVIGFVFGSLIDLNMLTTEWVQPGHNLLLQAVAQVAGCTILGLGIAVEVRCGSVTMPGEGFPVALSQKFHFPFHKAKICVDITLVVLGVLCCYYFFQTWQWYIVGIGTLFAMFYVGLVVRLVSKHLDWFDKLLAYQPGFRRYVYGLARFIYVKSAKKLKRNRSKED